MLNCICSLVFSDWLRETRADILNCISIVFLLYLYRISYVFLLYFYWIINVFLLYLYCISVIFLLYFSSISIVCLLYLFCIYFSFLLYFYCISWLVTWDWGRHSLWRICYSYYILWSWGRLLLWKLYILQSIVCTGYCTEYRLAKNSKKFRKWVFWGLGISAKKRVSLNRD